jgi:hypothetical protein
MTNIPKESLLMNRLMNVSAPATIIMLWLYSKVLSLIHVKAIFNNCELPFEDSETLGELMFTWRQLPTSEHSYMIWFYLFEKTILGEFEED